MKKPTTDDTTPETPTPEQIEPAAPVLEMPNAGGSYIRQPDGSLVKQEG